MSHTIFGISMSLILLSTLFSIFLTLSCQVETTEHDNLFEFTSKDKFQLKLSGFIFLLSLSGLIISTNFTF